MASFGLFFKEASFAAPHPVQLRWDAKVVARTETPGRRMAASADAQLIELLALDVDGERYWALDRLVDLCRSSRRGKPNAKNRLIADRFGSRR